MPHSPFSGSIWNALWILLPIAAVTFVSLFCTLGGDWYFFDPKHNIDPKLKDAGDFEPHSKRYQDLSKFAITLSGAATAFLLSIIASDKPVQAPFAQKVRDVAPITFGFFGCCIAFLVLFMVLQTFWYEEYCHSPNHDSYKRWKYALNNTFGWIGMLSFALGFCWLARNLFR